ncbi:UNVERIFIED_ORG: hypothetical protein EDF86_3409 [Pseudomonas psychrophila]
MNTLTIRFLSIALISVTSNVYAETFEHSAHTIASGLVQLSDNPAHLSHTWTGIGRLRGPRASYCTASLIDTRDKEQPSDTSPAYIITSQRCLNSSNAGNYTYDGGVQKNAPIEGNVYFNNFENTLGHTKKYAFKSIAWQSDGGLNLAIIELNDTLSNLMKAGVQPLTIASATPPAGIEILTLGIPHTSNLYATSCTQLPHVDVLAHPWVSSQILPNLCTALTEGGRGAAVLDKDRNELISLVVASTHGTDSVNKCDTLSPCEIKDNASLWSADTHYALPVSFLNQCFTGGLFAHDSPNCSLKNQAASLFKDPHSFPARLLERVNTNTVVATEKIEVKLNDDVPFYRYKYSHDVNACNSGAGYSDPLDTKKIPLILELDNTPGIHLLCVLGLSAPNISLGQVTSKETIALERFKATQIFEAKLQTRYNDNPLHGLQSYNSKVGIYWEDLSFIDTTKHSVFWDHASPFSEHYKYKYGPYASTDCSDPEGYEAVVDMDLWIANLLASGTVDTHLYSEVDLSSDASKRIMGHLGGVRSHKKLGHNDDTVKLCTIVYNQENMPSPPYVHVLKQL